MISRATARRKPAALKRNLLGLLSVLWLNMAVLPCAMAFGVDDHDCPHCPPADEQPMAGHNGHGDEAGPDCASVGSSCADGGAVSVDTRGNPLKVSDAGDDEVFVGFALVSTLAQPTTAFTASVDPPDPPGTSVPRHVLFCVYLD